MKNVLIDPKVQERADAKRQEIVEEIVRMVDAIIDDETDGGSVKTMERLTQIAAIELLRIVSNDIVDDKTYLYTNGSYYHFIHQIRAVVRPTICEKGIPKRGAVSDWIAMNVALKFIEKATVLFADRLREHDRNN